MAVAVAVVAVVLQMVYVEAVRSQARPDEFTMYRLEVAVEDGERLDDDDLKAVPVPQAFRETFRDAITSDELGNYVGERFERDAQQFDVLTFDLFQQPVGETLVAEIQDGKRLIALPVESKRLRGILRPGMTVDLAAPMRTRAGAAPRMMPVMEGVRVMAVGQRSLIEERARSDDRTRNFTHIHVQVTPEQWRTLATIEKMAVGPFELALRNPADNQRGLIPAGEINPRVIELIDRMGG